ncbi:alpha/beta hydrolase [Pedobacter yulinensis]|uniref:Alpha/beta hydrolase n=1 Tax=Pedobacter yulinensis TaxID=2126353 RepID=A0A2T3HPH5_9SPHI|nr:alpha/beta hydrolase [Pedobacter yulinensis]PST84307.1 alpha/beta hydrolase [Pedobacter yulinensis]
MKTLKFNTAALYLVGSLLFLHSFTFAQQKRPAQTARTGAKSGYAAVNGLKMYYEIQGTGAPVVLLHGSFMTISLNWQELMPKLAANRQVIAVELQGHGHTADMDRPITYENLADDVSALLRHLKIAKADIIGYSLGASAALQMVLRHPEQVRKLVMISGVFRNNGWLPEVEASFPSITADMFKGTPLETEYKKKNPDPGHWPQFVKRAIEMDTKPYDWGADKIRQTKAPFFIIVGDADGVQHEHAVEMYRLKGGGKMGDIAGIPESRLAILPASSHVGIIAQTRYLLPMINDFLDGTPQPRASF